MKRKTNLFYNTGQDSKFVTFSNYTEALTGNFLSTNTKLFPSVFLCLDIPSLNTNHEDSKREFIINTLIRLYENKLATLRDNINESSILPLSYLLEYLYKYDSNTQVTYIGNITEQDYLGAYTDTICTIDTEVFQNATIEVNTNINTNTIQGESQLYGWWENDMYIGPSIYKSITPLFDVGDSYIYNSGVTIKINKPSKDIKQIKFNVLIPLFTFVNVKDKFDSVDLKEETLRTSYNRNVPLGMWFANDYIELVSDNLYGQSWSLAIGSQFKPLPTEQEIQSDITKTSNADAFQTFAQILTRQNQLIDVVKASISTIEENSRIDNTNVYTDEDKYEVSQIPYKQDVLISGQNIKTVNNQSLLGRGNVEIKAEVDIYDIIYDTLEESKLTYDKAYSNRFTNMLLKNLENQLTNSINEVIIQHVQDKTELQQNINEVDSKVISLTQTVTDINNQVIENKNNIEVNVTSINNVTNRVSNVEENVTTLLNITIPTIQEGINKIQNDIKGINDSIDDIEELVETNTEDISELKDFVENLSIESISEDTIDSIYKKIFI
jgi:methyl-accepting chemotaxis protein